MYVIQDVRVYTYIYECICMSYKMYVYIRIYMNVYVCYTKCDGIYVYIRSVCTLFHTIILYYADFFFYDYITRSGIMLLSTPYLHHFYHAVIRYYSDITTPYLPRSYTVLF